jgi:hypothetical protein
MLFEGSGNGLNGVSEVGTPLVGTRLGGSFDIEDVLLGVVDKDEVGCSFASFGSILK